MSNFDNFNKTKQLIISGWSQDRIIEDSERKLVLLCENKGYIIYRILESPDTGNSKFDKMFENKFLIQFTTDLDKKPYINIGRVILGLRTGKGLVKEAIKELSQRIEIGKVLL